LKIKFLLTDFLKIFQYQIPRKITHNEFFMKYTFQKNNFKDTKVMKIGWVGHVKRIEETKKFRDILLKKQ